MDKRVRVLLLHRMGRVLAPALMLGLSRKKGILADMLICIVLTLQIVLSMAAPAARVTMLIPTFSNALNRKRQ